MNGDAELFRRLLRRRYRGFVQVRICDTGPQFAGALGVRILHQYLPAETDPGRFLVLHWGRNGMPRELRLSHPADETLELVVRSISRTTNENRQWLLLLREGTPEPWRALAPPRSAYTGALGLSPRQRELAWYLSNTEFTQKEIAHELNIAEGTLRTHVHRLFGKIGVRTRIELLARLKERDNS